MTGFRWGVAVCLTMSIVTTSAVHAQSKATKPAPSAAKPKALASDTIGKSGPTAAELDERAYGSMLKELRARLLKRGSWADLGTRCDPGALRVFLNDTTPELRAETESMMARMQNAIIVMGSGAAIDDADGRALGRTILGWEAGISRPNWDSDDGQSRPAFATGLTGDYPDPASDKCLSAPRESDTVTVVISALTEVDVTSPNEIKIRAFLGTAAPTRVRDEYFARTGGRVDASLEYIAIAPIVRWKEWAVAKVQRPVEKGGFEIGTNSKGGAVYLLRRQGAEWRLLAVVSTWGK